MAVFRTSKGDIPAKRKAKPKPNPWDDNADFMLIKAAIANAQLKPMEQIWMYIDEPAMAKKYDQKFPARSATDSMKRFIRSLGLQSDYHADKYGTDTPGQQQLIVTYEPGRWMPKRKKKG